MKHILSATTTLLLAFTSQAAPNFRIGYRGGTEYALPKFEAENANDTIAFSSSSSNIYGLPTLDQWESTNTNQGFLIRNVFLGSYISCSGQSTSCSLTEDEGTFFQSIQTNKIDGVTYYHLFATIEDIDGGNMWVLEGGDYLRVGVLDNQNELQEISMQWV
ncbi:hypothetical protein AtubIFM55763_000381 [Aspergillus tubingensis]|uniref:Similar to An04g02920 n=1 Tax=Aspergillus niger TaxID=5061 RepID=A0A100IAG2_ASPNG|nr:similar to An04g02920 [Aspergillus tubingensis]GAQ37632.1 similar to An04g02920 [Aspergillus niger]GFN13011.1 similar to An04g02920 [Aspergillus tubingensis]GLA56842.1 hypothetical protein AtubIFM54640_000503 [Aspergillus tubingensis]GLA70350.1 hypothetical protein AtubIFM55763_000381 [Aspergillus tubingensis]